jgi:mono/diheme cytochrome c family protein
MTRQHCVLILSFTLGSACVAGGEGMPPSDPAPEAPTWYDDVAHVVYDECVSCHQPGGIAPFSLLEYEIAAAFGPLMARVTAERTMPPMPVDNSGDCQTFDNARWLTDAEIDTIGAWVEAGMPVGDSANAPVAPAPAAGLEDADVVLDMGEEYTPEPRNADDYHCFVLETGLTEDRFVTSYEVVPGDPRVVHHVIAFSLETDADVARVRELDAAEPGPGYTCFGGAGAAGATPLVLWAPGGGAIHMPEGTGLPVGPRPVVLQLHYNLAAGTHPDRTRIRLRTRASVEKPAWFASFRDADMALPPRMSYVETDVEQRVPGDARLTVYGALPHMHALGRTLRAEAVRAGESTCLVNADRWDFEWQNAWFYESPLEVRGGDLIRLTCGYDTLERSDVTRWGEGTEDEMCLSYFYVTL